MKALQQIAATRQWVDDVVIAHNFCPFARFVRHPEKIRYCVATGDAGELLESLFQECQLLDGDDSIATTLLILDNEDVQSFGGFLDILSMADRLIDDWGFRGVYQLASFHPDYVFEGESPDSPTHFTNRSPYPVLHLIREDDIERVLADFGDPEKIYRDNIDTTTEKGEAHFQTLLAACKHAQKE